HWLVWKAAWKVRQQEAQQLIDAAIYHNTVIVSNCLKSWILYVKNKRVKHAHADFATRVWHANLKLQSFNHWYQRWHVRKCVRQHHLTIETHSELFRKRWVFWRLKQYVADCKEARSLHDYSVNHHNTKLMRLGLDSFRLNVVHSHIKVMRLRLARQLHTAQLQRQAWNKWVSVLDEREEQKMAHQTAVALKHYSEKLMKLCFSSLVDYATWRQQRKQSYAVAAAHFYLRTMPAYLFHMKVFVQMEKNCRQIAANAIIFRRARVFSQVFHKWYSAANQKRDERMMERMALLHRESVIVQATFVVWRQKTQESLTMSLKMDEAARHYLLSICLKAWTAWQLYIHQQKTQASNAIKARCHHIQTQLHRTFVKWKQVVQEQNVQRVLFHTAERHHSVKVMRICVAEWKTLVLQKRRFTSLSEERRKIHLAKLSREVIRQWHETAVRLAADRRREMAASVHHNRSLLQRVIQEWHRFAAIKAYRRSETQHLLTEAVAQLQQVKVTLYWQKWQKAKTLSMQTNVHLQQAEKHHHMLLLKKSIQAWRVYANVCMKKRLRARQSKWFHDVRLTARFYLLWKDRLAEAVQEQEKTDLALWQWSLALQKKVLVAWQAYAEFRKHKRARMLAASSAYRTQLVHKACCQWLATADSLSHFRSRMAAQHQAKAVVDSFNLVHRIALHWKVWARAAAAARRKQSGEIGGARTHHGGFGIASAPVLNYAYPPLVSTQRLVNVPPSSQIPIVSQVYPKTFQKSVGKMGYQQSTSLHGPYVQPRPEHATKSPARPKAMNTISYTAQDLKQRPPPKRPAFLAESLKRAGLFADSLEESSRETNQPDTAVSERGSSPAMSDLNGLEYPETGRFQPQAHERKSLNAVHTKDQSLSADVISGSASSLGAGDGDGAVKPLHLHNSEDTDHSGARTGTGSSSASHSPHAFTPSTQRSQFSGNPLLYSSPVSSARETWRSGVGTRPMPPGQGKESERAAGEGGFSGRKPSTNLRLNYEEGNLPAALDGETGVLLRGNLDGDGLGDYQQSQREQQQQHDGSSSDNEQVQGNTGKDTFVLLKPEFFMKKPSGSSSQQLNLAERDSRPETLKKSVLKHTPRNFASQATDPTTGLPPMAEWKSFNTAESSSNPDHMRDGTGSIRRTPREHTLHGSPRRGMPQSILHNKVSDSDGDASPLNTARSRGTVTFANPKSPTPEEELTNIRDRLKHFHNQKQKLRSLRKQYRQLSDWLLEHQSSQQHEDDEDSQNATEELNMLRLEVADLQSIVDSQRPVCERLVMRAKTLAQEIVTA
ncbi:protein sfi1 homolog, partial [Plakobranchus ocellatus]